MSLKPIRFPLERTSAFKEAEASAGGDEPCPCIGLDDGTISGLSRLEEKFVRAYRRLDGADKAYIKDLFDRVTRATGSERAEILIRALERVKAGE